MAIVSLQTENLVREYIPHNAKLNRIAGFFAAFSDVTRAKIICALAITELCVSDLSELLAINQTTCSHQLRILRDGGVVNTRRSGKIIFYSLKDKRISQVLLAGVDYLGY